MIIVLKPHATKRQIQHVVEKIKELGLKPMVSTGVERTIIGVIGPEDALRVQPIEVFPGVEKVMPVLKPYKLVSREFKPESSILSVKDLKIGGKQVIIMAGPCSVENHEMLMATAKLVKQGGAKILRGGAFKPRTSPYSFQGLGEDGLKYLREAADATGLHVITELLDPRDVELVERYTDIIQSGAATCRTSSCSKKLGNPRSQCS